MPGQTNGTLYPNETMTTLPTCAFTNCRTGARFLAHYGSKSVPLCEAHAFDRAFAAIALRRTLALDDIDTNAVAIPPESAREQEPPR